MTRVRMMKTVVFLCMVVSLVVGCRQAGPTDSAKGIDTKDLKILPVEDVPSRDTYFCYEKPEDLLISIDGKLDEKAWESTVFTPVFGDIVTGESPRYSVKAKILWDKGYLYLGYEVDDPNVWGKHTTRDVPMRGEFGGYKESFIKVFIDPDGNGKNYIEMHVSTLNKVCDKWQEYPWGKTAREKCNISLTAPANPHVEWDCPGLKTAVHVRGTLNDPYDIDQGWTAEIAIPFSSLEQFTGKLSCPPRAGDAWRMHLSRRYRASPDAKKVSYWTWPKVGQVDCHRPDTWGKVVFKGRRRTKDKKMVNLPKADFEWKALCVRGDTARNVEEIKRTVALAKRMGFNVLIFQAVGTNNICWYDSKLLEKREKIAIDPLKELIKEAKAKDMEVYAWTVNLRSASGAFFKAHPEYLQRVKPAEEKSAGKPRLNPDRVNIHGGMWLCPDRGLIDFEKEIIEEIVRNYDIAGIALDYVGYRNYYACFCEYSVEMRGKFAQGHPELSDMEVLKKFSENSLARWTNQVRTAVKKIKPDVKIATHVYPDFDLNVLCGNRLDVDYCGQTVAWFYKPFWSYEKIHEKTMAYKKAEGKYREYNQFVPFIGAYGGNLLKSPARLRTEIRIAGASGTKNIMVAVCETFLKNTDLADVMAEELK